MTGIPRNVAGWLARFFKRKAKEVVEETVEEVIDEVVEGVKEKFRDAFGVYTIEGYANGVPRRRYADGALHVGKKIIQPGRK